MSLQNRRIRNYGLARNLNDGAKGFPVAEHRRDSRRTFIAGSPHLNAFSLVRIADERDNAIDWEIDFRVPPARLTKTRSCGQLNFFQIRRFELIERQALKYGIPVPSSKRHAPCYNVPLDVPSSTR